MNKHFLKVVQGAALSLTSTVSILPRMRKGLQLLNLQYDRVSVYSKSSLLGHWGVKPYL